jgi:iron complex transport system ATP-binding protein
VTVLRVHNACASPWGEPLLQNINLVLEEGCILGVIGPNGAGKTSLLSALAADIPLTRGNIQLFNKPLAQWNPIQRARRVAVLPQLSLLNFPYTVEEVIMLGRSPHDTGARQDQIILAEVMQATDTTFLRDRLYTQLSGGEKQRVQLARVFAQVWHQPDDQARLLLLDEPTAALDLAHQQLLITALKNLAGRGCSIAVVVHDFNLLASFADQITALNGGRQIAYGTPGSVLTESVFADVFGVQVHISAHPESGRPLVIAAEARVPQ